MATANGPYRHGNRWTVKIKEAGRTIGAESYATESEAAHRVAEFTEAIDGERMIGASIDEYLQHKVDKCKPSTVADARFNLGRIFDAHRKRPLRWITEVRADELYRSLQTPELGFAIATQHNTVNAAKTFCDFAVKRRWFKASPFASVELEGKKKRGKPTLRKEEARLFLDACVAEGTPQSLAALTALTLGLSASEVTKRVVRDLDDGGRLLWVEKAKTESRNRTIEVPDFLRPFLVAQCQGKLPTAELFTATQGGHMNRDRIRDTTKRICALVGIPVVTAQSLRATAATLARDSGMAGHAVAASLGHKSQSVTERHYLAPGTSHNADVRATMRVLQGGK
jgi:integrase